MQVNLRQERRGHITGTYSLCWQADDGVSRSAEAEGRNISASGICVRAGEFLAPGLVVYLQGPPNTAGGYAIVRHCTLAGGGYSVGLEFSEEARKPLPVTDPESPDYYEFLQINPKADQATIRRIYRMMAQRFHPDNPETGDPERFLLLNQAYDVLSDPGRRAEYDASRQSHEPEADPIFELGAFVNGIEGETNRRLAILAILYNKRRTNSQDPNISLWDLERRMALPREYLDFATWYLKSKGYITIADNSDFALTASGVDFVEANAGDNPMLCKLLAAGSRTVTDFAERDREHPRAARVRQIGAATPQKADGGSSNGSGGEKALP